ncbi:MULTISPECIES: sodium-dependent transporter [unclassified Imperialibacter]|uniref:sodium-dependent transporter n=1 Tax=unclassified Imperialibacter TaxID=2629706 RepID=UPI001257CDB8|nr:MULTISPECIES: sodium-dependent transporter [unclassified Imperialibacter]CAD5299390.1 putative sodium-dependent transporter [Imperialibacter sp. 89]CAD5299976.1 putative sodium-dependent transporter [Imperialibacter sp. 75]VVT15514.1 putative sodium-dependent transporter [Imperialibacter sp. EC-SDR9]
MAARGGFSNKLGFIAAAAGSAVGLGNIWQFPYVTGQNGGAAFLLVYIGWIFLIGLPIMVGEIAVGRKAQSNPYGAYKKLGGKSWAYVGLFGIICGVMILSFYNVVAGWAFGYFLELSFGNLLNEQDYSGFFSAYVADFRDNLFFSIAFMVITAYIVYRGVQKGIEGTSKVLMPTLFLILIFIIIYGLTLPNAMDGVSFYLLPDFSLINGRTIYTALGQAFFSLSLGMGALITYGSYISRNDNIVNSAILVTIADTAVAFLAGLMIFPLVFSQGQSPAEGPGLVFVALLGVFQTMGPLIGKIVGGGFFLLLCFAALTSTISLLEVPVAFLVDEKKWSRKKAVSAMALLIFLIGLPSMLGFGAVGAFTEFVSYEGGVKSFMDLVQDLFFVISLPLGGFLLSVFISTRWKTAGLSEEISHGNPSYRGSFIEKFFNLMIVYVCPVVLGAMFLLTVLQKFFGVELI